jgi:FtsH-binding integral membrane protein
MNNLFLILRMLVLLLLTIPALYLVRWMKRKLRPRDSPWGLLAYFLGCLLLAFAYTYSLVRVILWVFPPATK